MPQSCLFIWAFLLMWVPLSPTVCSAEETYFGYCFESTVSLETVKQYLKNFLLEKDNVKFVEPEHCFQIQTGLERSEAIKKIIGQRFSISGSYQTTTPQNIIIKSELPAETCRLELIQETLTLKSGHNVALKFENGRYVPQLKKDDSVNVAKTTSNISLLEGTAGSLEFDDKKINVICEKNDSQSYRLTFFIESDNGKIKSTRLIKKDEEISLGDITQELKSHGNDIELSKGVNISKNNLKTKTNYSLKLK